MRLAYLISEYPKVSHSFIRREILALERRGMEITRIAIRGPSDSSPDGADIDEKALTRYVLSLGIGTLLLHFLRSCIRSPGRMYRALVEALRLSRGAEKGVGYHMAYLVEACVVASWMRSAGIKHVHAHFGSNPTTVAMLAATIVSGSFSFTAHGTVETDNAAGIAISEKVRRAAFVVAVSDYGRAQMMRWVSHDHWCKIFVVRCGLDRDYIAASPPPPVLEPEFVSVGRLSAEKGHLVLLCSMARLVRAGYRCRLVIVGDGPLRNAIVALSRELGIENCIRITGWLNGDGVRTEISSARALVLPSFSEGLPVVIMEAMALGRPVIASSVSGIPELVVHRETGWLVPPGNDLALYEAMRECLDSASATLSRMSVDAVSRVRERHDINAEGEKLVALFRRVVPSALIKD